MDGGCQWAHGGPWGGSGDTASQGRSQGKSPKRIIDFYLHFFKLKFFHFYYIFFMISILIYLFMFYCHIFVNLTQNIEKKSFIFFLKL